MAPVLFLALTIALPAIDMAGACRGEERGLPKDQYANAYKDCMQAEQAALAELRQKWAQYPSAAKAPCAALAQTFDSYVEELVCVQIRAGHSGDAAEQK